MSENRTTSRSSNRATIAGFGCSLVALFGLTAALVRRSDELRWASYWLRVGAAILTIPVFLSGDASEEAIERLSGASETLIDAHAAAARVSLLVSELLGLIALMGLTFARGSFRYAKIAVNAALIFGAFAIVSFTYAANLGGQIRHTQVRPAGQSVQQASWVNQK